MIFLVSEVLVKEDFKANRTRLVSEIILVLEQILKILTHSLLVVVFVKKEDVMQKTVAHVLESMV